MPLTKNVGEKCFLAKSNQLGACCVMKRCVPSTGKCPTLLRKMRERSFHIFPSMMVFHFVTNQTKANKN